MQNQVSSLMEGMVAVNPKTDCPHCTVEHVEDAFDFGEVKVEHPCRDCGIGGEVWVCLKCKVIFCSRYVNGHMQQHYQTEKHPICFSFADFSFWCYECDSYIIHPILNHVSYFYPQKFGEESDQNKVMDVIRASKHQSSIPEQDEEQNDS